MVREGGREGGRGRRGKEGWGRELRGRKGGNGVGREGGRMIIALSPCSSSSSAQLNITTPSGKSATMKKAPCFKMALWLAAYHEFFAKNVSKSRLHQ